MSLGGAACGGLLGIPLGAVIGLLVGLIWGHVSWGLDGAVVGMSALSAAGAMLGAWLGITADERSLAPSDDLGLPSPRGDFFPRAGKGAPHTPPHR
jgi:hypothetical protein